MIRVPSRLSRIATDEAPDSLRYDAMAVAPAKASNDWTPILVMGLHSILYHKSIDKYAIATKQRLGR